MKQRGQVLTEILVAISVVSIVIGGVAILISSSLIAGKKVRQVSTANSLALEMIESFEGVANNSWINIYCPPTGDCSSSSKGSGVEYSTVFSTSTNTWSIQSNRATTTVDGINYGRYFYIEDVDRDSSGIGAISSSGEDDPSTQKITAFVFWPPSNNFQVSEYITRSNNLVFPDEKWNTSGTGIYTVSQGYYSSLSGDTVISGNSITLSGSETPTTHYLESVTFDTALSNGANYNFIKWKGAQPSGTVVKFQLATSTTTSSFSFKGPSGTNADYYTSSADGSGVAPATIYTRFHNDHRYFRYRVFLEYNGSNKPTIDEIVVGYSP